MNEITLDAYAARSCPVKVFNVFDPTRLLPVLPDESQPEIEHKGLIFEQQILDQLVATTNVTDLRSLQQYTSYEHQVHACQTAMARGDQIIVGGVLPIDYLGHRRGYPDLLIRGAAAADGGPGYHVVEVKLHQMLGHQSSNGSAEVSSLAKPAPQDRLSIPEWSPRISIDLTLIQLAHYWHVLNAVGRAALGMPLAGVIGVDELTELGGPVITWLDLTAKTIRTFSRTSSSGWRFYSALARYQHEHQFRVRVAKLALTRTKESGQPPPVSPVVIPECTHCSWWPLCRQQLPDDAITLKINKSPLDVKEISALARLGISTLNDLAKADLSALLPKYLPQVTHRFGAEDRLRLATRRAQLLAKGIFLERITSGPIEIPRARVEIDFDIETSDSGRTYLWGTLITQDHQSTYYPFVRFEELNTKTELALLAKFADFIVPWLDRGDALIYHYSDYERVFLHRLAKGSSDPNIRKLIELLATTAVDLFPIVKQHFFGVYGLGLKTMATHGAGFHWRDTDPGGLNSQSWFNDAVHDPDDSKRVAAQVRVLQYNEDDVQATKKLRNWLASLN